MSNEKAVKNDIMDIETDELSEVNELVENVASVSEEGLSRESKTFTNKKNKVINAAVPNSGKAVINGSNTILIKPAPGSKKFKSSNGNMDKPIETFYGILPNGDKEVIDSRPFEMERFSDTLQIEPPYFSSKLNRWLVIDPEDPMKQRLLTDNSDKLNSIVSRCGITYPEGHLHHGEIITGVNIFDLNDPFFIDKRVNLNLKEGGGVFKIDKSNPLNEFLMLCLRARKQFKVGSALDGEARSSTVRSIIVDKGIVKEQKNIRRKKDVKALEYFTKLSNDKKVKISIALGIISNPNIDFDTIEDLLYHYIRDNVTKVSNTGLTKQDNFIGLIESGAESIETNYLFNSARAKGIIKKLKGVYVAYNVSLGKTIPTSIDYLSLDSSKQLRDRIVTALNSYDQ